MATETSWASAADVGLGLLGGLANAWRLRPPGVLRRRLSGRTTPSPTDGHALPTPSGHSTTTACYGTVASNWIPCPASSPMPPTWGRGRALRPASSSTRQQGAQA